MIYRTNFGKTDDFPRIKTDSGCQEQGIIQRELFREAATAIKSRGQGRERNDRNEEVISTCNLYLRK